MVVTRRQTSAVSAVGLKSADKAYHQSKSTTRGRPCTRTSKRLSSPSPSNCINRSCAPSLKKSLCVNDEDTESLTTTCTRSSSFNSSCASCIKSCSSSTSDASSASSTNTSRSSSPDSSSSLNILQMLPSNLDFKTNNWSESYNAVLQRRAQQNHLTIWTLIELLITEETAVRMKHFQSLHGKMTRINKIIHDDAIEINQKMIEFNEKFENNEIQLDEYLLSLTSLVGVKCDKWREQRKENRKRKKRRHH